MSPIHTERLELRSLTLDDLPAMCELSQDADVMEYIGGPQKATFIEDKLNDWMSQYARLGFGLRAVVLQSTQECIGFCGLIEQSVHDQKRIELGYRLKKAHWRKGYGKEAAIATLDYAFHTLELPECIALIHRENLPSQKLAESLGFQQEESMDYKGFPIYLYQLQRL